MPTADQIYQRYNQISENTRNFRDSISNKLDQERSNLTQKYDVDSRKAQLDSFRKQAANTERMLSQLPQNVQNRTAGRLMTAGQLARLQATEARPLAQTLQDISRSRDVEQAGLRDTWGMIDSLLGDKRSNLYNTLQSMQQDRNATFEEWRTQHRNEAAKRQEEFQREQARIQNELRQQQLRAQQSRYDLAKILDDLRSRTEDLTNRDFGRTTTRRTDPFVRATANTMRSLPARVVQGAESGLRDRVSSYARSRIPGYNIAKGASNLFGRLF